MSNAEYPGIRCSFLRQRQRIGTGGRWHTEKCHAAGRCSGHGEGEGDRTADRGYGHVEDGGNLLCRLISVGSMILRKLSEALPRRRLTMYAASYMAIPSLRQKAVTLS